MANSESSSVTVSVKIEDSLGLKEQSTVSDMVRTVEEKMEQNMTSEKSSSGGGNMIWIKEEPVDNEMESQLSDENGCGEWPGIINMEPEVIVDEAGVGKCFCFYCQLACRSLHSLKKHIRNNHSELLRSETSHAQKIKSFGVCDSGSSPSRECENRVVNLFPLSGLSELTSKQNKIVRGPGTGDRRRRSIFALTIDRQHMCPHCDYKAAKTGTLKRHIMVRHTYEKPYRCSYCDYGTAHPGTLKRHVMVRHTKERPYLCPHCEYRTAESGTLKSHIMAKHTNEKPYACPYCEYGAPESGRLKKHIMSKHTKEKPFSCPQCDYKSARNGDLKTHIMVKHTDTKPFSCLQCEYKTAMSGNLRRHITSVHFKEKPFPCPHCEYRATRKGNLKNHITDKHAEVQSPSSSD